MDVGQCALFSEQASSGKTGLIRVELNHVLAIRSRHFDNLVAEWQEMHESWNESGDVFFFFG